MTSHPCNRSFWRGFKYCAKDHFECCDKFLFGKEEKDKDNYIWLNFPENNK